MATDSSILPWEIPWTEKPDGLQSMESQKSQTSLSDETTPPHICGIWENGTDEPICRTGIETQK